ncbi:hypothetical protein [Sphingomonas pruni]|jgi:hypothetical protein|uniref:hypothetical protein n=1 Tax=Sphingomonas pruni TaxID=40683 RepID=UPI0012EE6874|nr:hypothetical protein [Sphingomonas pruni]
MPTTPVVPSTEASEEKFALTKQQFAEAQQALDIAALNGIVFLAETLKKRSLLAAGEIQDLHETMTKPLSLPQNAANPAVQDAHHNLDLLFSGLLTVA